MASVDRNALNGLAKLTDVHAGGQSQRLPFDGEYVFGMDAFAAFALQLATRNQQIDGGYGRGLNDGRGLVGEGGDRGPGVVGIAGNVIARPNPGVPRQLWDGPFPGRGFRAGVVGLGADPTRRRRPGEGTDAVGVFGQADNAGVVGRSRTTGVIGDGTAGQIGVEGFGTMYGVYGHVDFASPNRAASACSGAAAMDLGVPDSYTGRAGVFVGPGRGDGRPHVHRQLGRVGHQVRRGAPQDGTHRLLYSIESPESQFEDFGEARLVKGRARVAIDRDFAAVADTRQYHVFLTPYGDSHGLYVSAPQPPGVRGARAGRWRDQPRLLLPDRRAAQGRHDAAIPEGRAPGGAGDAEAAGRAGRVEAASGEIGEAARRRPAARAPLAAARLSSRRGR